MKGIIKKIVITVIIIALVVGVVFIVKNKDNLTGETVEIEKETYYYNRNAELYLISTLADIIKKENITYDEYLNNAKDLDVEPITGEYYYNIWLSKFNYVSDNSYTEEEEIDNEVVNPDLERERENAKIWFEKVYELDNDYFTGKTSDQVKSEIFERIENTFDVTGYDRETRTISAGLNEEEYNTFFNLYAINGRAFNTEVWEKEYDEWCTPMLDRYIKLMVGEAKEFSDSAEDTEEANTEDTETYSEEEISVESEENAEEESYDSEENTEEVKESTEEVEENTEEVKESTEENSSEVEETKVSEEKVDTNYKMNTSSENSSDFSEYQINPKHGNIIQLNTYNGAFTAIVKMETGEEYTFLIELNENNEIDDIRLF